MADSPVPFLKVSIRKATEADSEAIGTIHAAAWKTTYQGIVHEEFLKKQQSEQRAQEALTRIQNPSTDFLIAELDNQVVGFVDSGKSRNLEIADGQIHSIYIARNHQHLGIGNQLFKIAFEKAELRSFRNIFVSVLSKNAQAVSFYKKQGGKLVGHDCVVIEEIRYDTDTFYWDLPIKY